VSDDADWAGYDRSHDGRAPRPFLLDALARSGPKHWHVFDVVARRGLALAPRP